MYPITSQTAALFANMNRQVVDISFSGLNETLRLTENDLVSGSFSLSRYSASGNAIELGSASASEVSFKLDNTDGRFNDVTFEGARMFIRLGVVDDSGEEPVVSYIPMGYFTIDEVPRKLRQIDIVALDDMVRFDRPIDYSLLTFPMTVSELVGRLCAICNVRLRTNVSLLVNSGYTINSITGDPATYRQLLIWAAEIMGCCAFIDWDGYLCMQWYTGSVSRPSALTPTNRFSSDYAEQTIEITGVGISNGDDYYLSGTDEYAIIIEGNGLVPPSDFETVADGVFGYIGGTTYLPFSASTVPLPHLYPLDTISFKVGDSFFPSIVTEVGFKINGSMQLSAKGESAVRKGYASMNPLTSHQQSILQQLQDEQNYLLNDRVQSVLAFNELISNALGLHVTPVEQPDGSVIYYMHDQTALEDSMVIFTMTANGIAWTNTGWNGGSPVWQSGVTAAGDALFRMLSAEGITVSKEGEDYTIQITPSAFRIYYRQMLVTEISKDEMTIPKAVFTNYAECGKIRMVPYNNAGANILFLD